MKPPQPWSLAANAAREAARQRALDAKLVKGEPITILLSEIEPETVQWFWPGRVAFGKLNLVDGDPDQGKSSLTLDLAARVSKGRPLPDGTPCDEGTVVFLTAEDGLADTIRPRLDAMGGDALRVVMFEAVGGDDGAPRQPSFPQDTDTLRSVIVEAGARLVVVDPMTAFLGDNINSWRDHDVRRALAPLAKLAEETGAAIVLVRHLSKNEHTAAIYRGGGSIGIIGAARVGLLVASDPDDPTRHVLAVLKNNLALKPPALAFRIVGADNGSSRLAWEGAVDFSVKTLLAAAGDDDARSEREDAMDFLRRELRDGPMEADVLYDSAEAAGISKTTLKRAKRDLGVESVKIGGRDAGSHWEWRLLEGAPSGQGDRRSPVKSFQTPFTYSGPGKTSTDADNPKGDRDDAVRPPSALKGTADPEGDRDSDRPPSGERLPEKGDAWEPEEPDGLEF